MNPKLIRALEFLRVLDENGNLSLTNIAMMGVLARILSMPNVTVTDLATFLAAVVGYHIKRFAAPASVPEDLEPLKTAIASLQTKVTSIQMSNNLTRK